ncbi:MAG: energy transducer TonB, partial [Thiohalocapsa sp.]
WVVAVALSLGIHVGVLMAARWLHWLPVTRDSEAAVPLTVFSVATLADGSDALGAGGVPTKATAAALPPADPAVTTPAPVTSENQHQTVNKAASEPQALPRAEVEQALQPPPTPSADALAEQLAAPPTPPPLSRDLAAPTPPRQGPQPPPSSSPAHWSSPPQAPPKRPSALAKPASDTAAAAKPARAAKSAPPKLRLREPLPVLADPAALPGAELSGLAALDAEIAAARRAQAVVDAAARAEPEGQHQPPERSGLAALDAEIAAARRRADRESTAPPASIVPQSADDTRAGLAALDAEIVTGRTAGRNARADGDAGSRRAAATRSSAARKGNRSNAPTDATARGKAERRYLAALQRALARERYYPPAARRRGLEGTTKVQFTIDAGGAFSGIRVSESAGAANLDDAAQRTVQRLARFEPIPAVIGRNRWTVQVPIVFRIN